MRASNRVIALAVAAIVSSLGACSDDTVEDYMPRDIDGPVVFASGLKEPTKIVLTPRGNLLVAESGDGANRGRISILDHAGVRTTLLDGLPSAPNREGGTSGPSGLALRGRTLFVAIGEGDTTLLDSTGAEVVNPTPSSPILSSVLEVELDAHYESGSGDFFLQPSDHDALKAGDEITLDNARREQVRVRLVADFPDTEPDPFVGIRSSNPFGVAVDGGTAFVNDAGLNRVVAVDVASGQVTTLAQVPPIPNPLPFGPPLMDPVPTSIHVFDGDLLVTLLVGFPFPPGTAEVREVERSTGTQTTFIAGLSSALDALPARIRSGPLEFFVVEISTDFLADAPGRLLRFGTPSAVPEVVADGLVGPTSVAVSSAHGDLFVTSIFTGEVIRAQID